MLIRQITIIGTGLIGGSFGQALKARPDPPYIVGCDRDEVLARAKTVGAIDKACADPIAACRGSQVVMLALPVSGIIDMLERIGPYVAADTLLTDAGSTKVEIVARAKAIFGRETAQRFLPGHPMAGKESSGIGQADPDLFQNATWLFTPIGPPQPALNTAIEDFKELVQRVGANPVMVSVEQHDEMCAFISHLPQMISTALAGVMKDFREGFSDPFHPAFDINQVGGRALREMTRIASSPYSMWRDIAYTNAPNIEKAMLQLELRLAHIRENLKTPALRDEFARANPDKV
jgi:prephenate dehydrogenase